MEHKVATLEIYFSDRDNGESSHLNVDRESEGKYKIVLNPNLGWQERDSDGEGFEKKHPWDTIAHELGHFVAKLAKRSSHDDFYRMFVSKVPAELEAWRIAHEILPEPVMENPSPVEKPSLKGYGYREAEE